MTELRPARSDDVDALLPRMRAFNAGEGIELDPATHRAALVRLIASPDLGGVWIAERDGATIGYAVVTYGYDLELLGAAAFGRRVRSASAPRFAG